MQLFATEPRVRANINKPRKQNKSRYNAISYWTQNSPELSWMREVPTLQKIHDDLVFPAPASALGHDEVALWQFQRDDAMDLSASHQRRSSPESRQAEERAEHRTEYKTKIDANFFTTFVSTSNAATRAELQRQLSSSDPWNHLKWVRAIRSPEIPDPINKYKVCVVCAAKCVAFKLCAESWAINYANWFPWGAPYSGIKNQNESVMVFS